MDGGDSQTNERLKVFVSYARTDSKFADQLVLALQDKGFEPKIDRHDIDAAEKWKTRLTTLIQSSDTVVFVLTEAAARSPACAWEVEEAVRAGKRIVPVMPFPMKAPPEGPAPPPQLSELQYIYFFDDPSIPMSGYYDGVMRLERALKVDVHWLREQTRLLGFALDWLRDSSDDRLLRGSALDEALKWRLNAPAGAVVPGQIKTFIDASEAGRTRRDAEARAHLVAREKAIRDAAIAIDERSAAEARLRQRTYIALTGAIVLVMLAVIGFGFAARQTATAADNRAQVFAALTEALAKDGRGADAMLMAVYADPAANRDLIVHLQRPNGFASALDALVYASPLDRETKRFTGHESAVNSVALSPDGRRILTGSEDKTARLWDAETGKTLKVLSGHKGWVTSVALSPDGRRILTGSQDKTARLWDAETGKALKVFSGHLGWFTSAAFSPDGQRILTGSYDKTARLWDAETGKALRVFSGHEEEVSSVAFSPDGRRILTGSLDKTARLWALPPILFATPNEKVRMACKALSQMAFTSFTDAERNKFPILADEPRDPCKAWGH